MLKRVAVCCSVLQCVAVCCSVLQCVTVSCSELSCIMASPAPRLPCGAVCCCALQCAVCHDPLISPLSGPHLVSHKTVLSVILMCWVLSDSLLFPALLSMRVYISLYLYIFAH